MCFKFRIQQSKSASFKNKHLSEQNYLDSELTKKSIES